MQLEFFDIPSPCVSVCQSDDKGFCCGCYRTREERKDWINLDNDTKQKVIKRCKQRKKRKLSGTKAKVVIETVEIVQPSLLDPQPNSSTDNNTEIDFSGFEL